MGSQSAPITSDGLAGVGSPATALPLNTPYTYSFQATGNPTPTFAVTPGRLPPPLKLTKNGVLSGTTDRAGTYTFTLTASNGRVPDAVSPRSPPAWSRRRPSPRFRRTRPSPA